MKIRYIERMHRKPPKDNETEEKYNYNIIRTLNFELSLKNMKTEVGESVKICIQ